MLRFDADCGEPHTLARWQRQFMPASGVRQPIKGNTIGERILDAMERKGLNISQLAKLLGTRWGTVQGWTTDKAEPQRYLIRLAEALDVTTDELLGIAEGQEPDWASWQKLKKTPEFHALSDGERRWLRTQFWPPNFVPALKDYYDLIRILRDRDDG